MENALDEALRGRVFANRYRIEERLGEGAMGVVYRARHVKLARSFAIKVLNPQLLASEKVQRRFDREAELAATLRHENLIGVVDVGECDGMKYLVMDLAEGETLSALIAEGPMAPLRMLRIARQLCDGLAHAHDAGLIHRDFKPDNVIVQRTRDGEDIPRIVDFGIALLREDATASERERLTTAGIVLGTPHYMAPEHASGGKVDHRIDLFALGVICFEMMTGRLPFDGDGVDVARANMMYDPPRMRSLVAELDPDELLEAFTRKLMARSLANRIATAKEARALLDLIEKDRDAAAIALGLEPAAPPAPPAPRPMLAMPVITPVRQRAANTMQPDSQTTAMVTLDRDTIETRPVRRRPYVLAALATALVVTVGAVALRGTSPKPTPVAHVAPPPPPPPAIATAVAPPVVEQPVESPAPPKLVIAKITAKKAPSPVPPVANPMPSTTLPPLDVPPTAAELAQQYAAVGRKLSALERTRGQPATLELWPRYRNIRIQALLAKPEDRKAGAATLREIDRAVDVAMQQ